MAIAKHTPGPWQVKHTDTTYYVKSADGIRVVSTSWHSRLRKPYPLRGEAFANARLIAAAPDMFAALKRLSAIMSFDEFWPPCGCFEGTQEINDAMSEARAALAKALSPAEGEE